MRIAKEVTAEATIKKDSDQIMTQKKNVNNNSRGNEHSKGRKHLFVGDNLEVSDVISILAPAPALGGSPGRFSLCTLLSFYTRSFAVLP